MNVKKVGSLAVLVTGIAVAMLAVPPARGGTPSGATYVGSAMCEGCHRALTPTAVAGYEKSMHPKAMWSVSSPPAGVQIVGDFSANAPFAKDQIAYVLGTGVRAQAYLDKDYKVLPGQWDAKAKSWTKIASVDAKTQCLGCHTTAFNASDNTYKAMGVGCEMCHGPGSAHVGSSMEEKKNTIVLPTNLDPQHQAMLCGQCHSQGKSKDGVHAFPIGFKPGDDLDQYFTLTQKVAPGAMNAQYNELRFGGGKHLAVGTVCLTCHDPHNGQGVTMLKKPVPALCQQCHQNLAGPQHAGNPDCRTCHMPNDSHAFVPPHAG